MFWSDVEGGGIQYIALYWCCPPLVVHSLLVVALLFLQLLLDDSITDLWEVAPSSWLLKLGVYC